MQFRNRTVAAVISLAAAAALALAYAPGAQAETPILPHGKPIASFTPQNLVAKPAPHLTSPVKTTFRKRCAPLPARSAARKAGATTACIQVTARPGSAKPATSSDFQPADTNAATCSVTQPGYYTYDRLDYCLSGFQVTYTEYNEDDPGETLGTGTLTVSSSASLSASSGQWQESETVTLSQVSGLVEDLNVGFTASCDASCTATSPSPWVGSQLLTEGQSASGSVTFQATPGAGLESSITTSYNLQVTQPGTTPLDEDVPWSNPRQVRCDTTFADNTSTGCVIPDIRPQFTLSLSEYGAAAAAYGFAEQDWIDHWGADDSPLQRLADPDAQTANRTNTCGSGATRTFVYLDDIVPNDSCDEYPFAATYQGGTNGGLCADVIPLEENGVWEIYPDPNAPTPTFNEPCIRAHVPNDQNSNAGLALGRFAQSERVIDNEKYDVVVTT